MHGPVKVVDESCQEDQMKHDVVYILSKDVEPDELRYSLRSVEENFPFRKVWFFCGCPKGFKPDGYVPFKQIGRSKWQKSTSTFRAIGSTEGVSDEFWLFNDDFFVLEKVEDLPYMMRGMLADHVAGIRSRRAISGYANGLDDAREQLHKRGMTTYDYALHVPMLINKRKAVEVIDEFPNCPMFRSLYGNYCEVGGITVPDVKVYDLDSVPEEGQVLLSTGDVTFRNGAVGRYIRERFAEPSRWEI